jgi:alkylation response protein AidB-like acyl-CoA dehydrogenase
LIDFELTDEQRLIRETARDFADGEIIPVARDNDRNERFDLDSGRSCPRNTAAAASTTSPTG